MREKRVALRIPPRPQYHPQGTVEIAYELPPARVEAQAGLRGTGFGRKPERSRVEGEIAAGKRNRLRTGRGDRSHRAS